MAKSYIWIEETNQRTNEFSIGYIMNPNLHKNNFFREQVKVYLKTTFGPSTNAYISKILLKVHLLSSETEKRIVVMYQSKHNNNH